MNRPITRRVLYRGGFAALSGARAWTRTHDSNPALSSDSVLADLSEGNRRFAAGRANHPRQSPARIRETSGGQHPRAIVLACSDSRVSPELLFDQGVGDLFVVRVPGNVANNDQIASIEYAVEHLAPPLCVVLGHSRCGAVMAVVNGEQVSDAIARMVAPIAKAVAKVRPHTSGADLLNAAIQANVGESIDDLQRGSQLIAGRVRAAKLKLTGGIYKVEDGKITWL